MEDQQKIRVLVADCHHMIRECLANLLSCEPDISVVGNASNAEEAITLFREHKPDVAVMDLRMNGASAVEAIETIRTDFPNARILVLATFAEDEEIFPAHQAGALGCLLKDMPRKEIGQVIRAVYTGQKLNFFLF